MENKNNQQQKLNESINPDSLITPVMISPTSSFDIVYWIIKIAKFWYLFLIGITLAFGLAYLKNKSWTPSYKTTTKILIEDSKKQSFGGDPFGYSTQGVRGTNNQMIMYGSYDLIKKSVEELNITSELYQKNRFKNANLYKKGPVEIHTDIIFPGAYGLEYGISGIDNDTYQISFEGNNKLKAFQLKGTYGKPLQHTLFTVLINKSDFFIEKYNLNFRFISDSEMIGSYSARLSQKLLMEGASVMEVSLVGPIAERDVDFLNILNQQFFTDNLMRKNISSQKAIDFINQQLLIIRDSITASESKLNQYQAETGIFGQQKSTKMNAELEALDQKRSELKLKKEYLESLSNYLKNSHDILVSPSDMGIQSAQLDGLVAQYNGFLSNLKTMKPENPIYKKLSSQMNDTKMLILAAVVKIKGVVKTDENDMENHYQELMAEVSTLPEKERQLLAHERDFKINDSYNTYLMQRRIESQIQMASNAPDNLILDKPRTVSVTNQQDIHNTYVLYISIVIVIIISFIVCRELIFNFTLQSRDEVERISGLPILGTIERTDKKMQVVVKSYSKSAFAESFRNLRSRMEYIVQREKAITMLVTSTEPKDGKTFIASNLASSYELTGSKVLIADFDLRRPALSKSLGLEHAKGISNYLIGQVSLEDAIVKHPEYEFDVLPAGNTPPNPSELLRNEKTVDMISKLKERYDYLILDCSPVGLVSDAHFLARHVDTVLYVVRNNKTNRNFFKYTIKELKEDNINNMVIVYNDVNLRSGYSGYGSKRYYGKSSYYIKHDSYYHNEISETERKHKYKS